MDVVSKILFTKLQSLDRSMKCIITVASSLSENVSVAYSGQKDGWQTVFGRNRPSNNCPPTLFGVGY